MVGYAHRKISSKGCGEKIQPQISANEIHSRKVDENEPTSRRTIGCAFEVSDVLGPGFLESVYEKVLYLDPAERRPRLGIFRLICVHARSFVAKKRISSKPNGGHSLPYVRLSLVSGFSALF